MNLAQARTERENKRELKVPHTLVIITSIIILVSIATYIVPGGAYEKVVKVVNGSEKTIIVDGSFKYIESQPQGVFEVLQAPVEGIIGGAEIIAFLFVVGGAFNLITRTKAIDFGIVRVTNIFKGKEILVIPMLTFLFSLGGAVFGMSEEAVPFVAIIVPLALSLGYDSIVAVGITYLACELGFSSAMLNPFTVGIAQSIAEIPMFSGIEYRTIIWFITTCIGTVFLMMYASKIKKNPKLSLVYESDQIKRANLGNYGSENEDFRMSHKIILLLLALCIGIIVWGVLTQGFWIPQIAAVFLATGLMSGFIGKLGTDEMADAFIEGAKGMIGAAVMLGFARAIVIIAENANIIDTILYNLSQLIGNLPPMIAAYIMYPIQMFINFFVSSGSGQAALTMPILAPLGDLVGISRQLTVLIYQLGDGFSNTLFPTSGILIACLGLAGVPYGKWLKWVLPLQGILFILSLGFITIGSLMQWA
ncbi:YfcC family protein [Romboutsia sp. 1001713B170207_170306_H8]|uniref:YfcC family protein n=1 Tax=Romboutsia sp. 1001713B170207_170306_H8 TaxID=2787112 RepID=UPI00082332BE|nr:YfcC family protein [Romboutsia sp. 1001713B170207_170306_H8]SCH88151.1 Putative p-aminobenzoyl-glutamate transporter [uncultured Clostridium sp.]